MKFGGRSIYHEGKKSDKFRMRDIPLLPCSWAQRHPRPPQWRLWAVWLGEGREGRFIVTVITVPPMVLIDMKMLG